MSVKIKLRRGTEAQWLAANPVLASGEPSYAIDTNTFKVGDGTSTWSDLQPIAGGGGGGGNPSVVQLGSVSGTINTNASLGDIFDLTLAASGTLANPSGSVDGQTLRWRITYGGSGIPLSLDANFRIPSSASSPLPFSSTSGSMDILGATYDSSRNKWDVIAFVPGY